MLIYRHNKTGNLYHKLTEAEHTETHERFVIYQSVETGSVWARNRKQFYEMVLIDGKQIPRFQEIDL